MTINEESLRKGFIDEARELIQKLEETVLVLEDDMQDTESIHEIFRVMHTLKGTSGMFGFHKVEKLTHDVENVYQMIREETLQVNESIINITLKSIDLLHTLIEQNDELSVENEVTYNEILTEVAQKYTDEHNEEAVISDEAASGEIKTKYVYVHYTPSKDIMNRGLNPYIIFENLNYVCKFKTSPTVPEYSKEEEEKLLEEFQNNPIKWDIYCYLKGSYDDLMDEFMFYMDDEYKIFPIDYEAYKPGSDFLNYYNSSHDQPIDTVEITSIFEELEPTAVKKEVTQVEKVTKKEVTFKTVTKNEADLSIRVSTDKLDQLVNNIGELVIINSQLSFVAEDINHFLIKKLIANIDKLSKNLRDNALELRLIPIGNISLKFKRLVRDLCTKLNKKVDFVTVGGDTQLDSNIIKAIESPLMHIIRNSLDHGIESPEERIQKGKEEKGIIRLIAFYSGANVFIQVQDDGKGINKDYIRQKAMEKGLINPTDKLTDKELYDLIFVPGFSTAQNLTDVSGRGVGMDVVKRNIHELRGMIEIDSEIDLGTSVSLKVPLSLSIIDTLLVEIDNESFLVPINTVESCHKVMHADLISSNNQQYNYQNQLLPYVYLRSFFDFGTNPPDKENMVVLSANDRKYGLVVDKVIGEFQAVVKPLGVLHKKQQFLTGASVLGNGNLALIIDTNKIAEHIKETELKRDY